jgi:hypothetical protein
MTYDLIAREYPGWGITEIKNLTRRERDHWLSLMKWRRSG